MSGINWSPASGLFGLDLPRKAIILVALTGGGYKLVPWHCIRVENDRTAYVPGETVSDWKFIDGYAVVDADAASLVRCGAAIQEG